MSNDLNKAKLESKDKDELTQIASAMGVKPPSRARKAEIVDLILDLAGGPAAGEAEKSEKPTAEKSGTDKQRADKSQGDKAKRDEPSGESNASNAGRPAATATPKQRPSTPAAYTADPMADARAEAGGGRRPAQQKNAKGGQGNRSDRDGDGKQNDQGNQGRQNQGKQKDQNEQGNQKDQGKQNDQHNQQDQGNQKDQNSQDAQDQANESGNRKRRRRGRNRDRNDGDDYQGDPVEVDGWLDLRDDGYGFLRVKGWLPSRDDVYVPVKFVRQFGLRRGDRVRGTSRPANRSEKNPALLTVDAINERPPSDAADRPHFDDLTPLFPDERLTMERPDNPINMTTRIIDLVSPIGKGQRGLIVAPPKAGKTSVMKEIARSVEVNNPEVELIVLLLDERPEEVTDMKRWLKSGEVVASTFDRPTEEHTLVAEITIERARRMVEMGLDVCIICDGITRLARAYNLAAPATGRVMSGGVDAGALYPPKRFFGAARNVEEGGSLTIIASALVETGSRMDEVIFEEFKGTGNMELRLDRHAAERRIYPAIDVDASSTRQEELLFERKELQQVWKLRKVLSGMAAEKGAGAGLELLMDRLREFPTNAQFLAEVK